MTVLVAVAQGQTSRISQSGDRFVAQAPADQTNPKVQAQQLAIAGKDPTAIFNSINQTPRANHGRLAVLLVESAQPLAVTNQQFAASPAALVFADGELTRTQQNALAVVPSAQGGLAAVANLPSNDLVVADNQSQTRSQPKWIDRGKSIARDWKLYD